MVALDRFLETFLVSCCRVYNDHAVPVADARDTQLPLLPLQSRVVCMEVDDCHRGLQVFTSSVHFCRVSCHIFSGLTLHLSSHRVMRVRSLRRHCGPTS